MRMFNALSALYTACILSNVDEVPAGTMPVDPANPGDQPTTAPGDTLTAAPGCEAPKPDRITFPQLVAAGGKFRSVSAADGSVHFDHNLIPKTTGKDGKEIAGLPAWPRPTGEDGKPLPLPWDGHSRLKHKALTADCFDSRLGYLAYRAAEAYDKCQICLDDYNSELSGQGKKQDQASKKHATVLSELNQLAATLSPEKAAEVAKVMEMLAALRGTPISPPAASVTVA